MWEGISSRVIMEGNFLCLISKGAYLLSARSIFDLKGFYVDYAKKSMFKSK